MKDKRDAGLIKCKYCKGEIESGKGLICRSCKNEKAREYYKSEKENKAEKDYTNHEEALLKQFLVAWTRRSRAEHECIYMDFKKHIKKSSQSNSAIEMMKKYNIEWERKPKSKEHFENLYHEYRKFLGLPARTIKNKPQ